MGPSYISELTLTSIHQTEHQTFVMLRMEQEQWCQALLQAQEQNWQLLGTLAAAPAKAAGKPHVMLTKMGPQDDPEAFVELFKDQLMAQQLPLTNLLEYPELNLATGRLHPGTASPLIDAW